MRTKLNPANFVNGRVRLFDVPEESDQWSQVSPVIPNLVLYQWSELTSKLLTAGDSAYRISGMLLEFENVASPGDTVTAPSFDRSRTISYYQGLGSFPGRDYLRVPLSSAQVETSGAPYTNNSMIFNARSTGTVGMHGETFSDSVNSVIFGASLVAMVDPGDASQDPLFSSLYFDAADQQPKLPTSQIGIEWSVDLQ